jgi:RNA polymerase sigma-70 factor (ECF subfamily)
MAAPFRGEEGNAPDWMESFTHPGPDAEHQLMQQEVQAAVEAGLLELSEAERAVLVLYHQEECSYEAIADALSLPIGTVRTHLHRGRKRLGEMVTQSVKRLKPPGCADGCAVSFED